MLNDVNVTYLTVNVIIKIYNQLLTLALIVNDSSRFKINIIGRQNAILENNVPSARG